MLGAQELRCTGVVLPDIKQSPDPHNLGDGTVLTTKTSTSARSEKAPKTALYVIGPLDVCT